MDFHLLRLIERALRKIATLKRVDNKLSKALEDSQEMIGHAPDGNQSGS
jgi:hypothetical protein